MGEQNTQDLLHRAGTLKKEHQEIETEINNLLKSPTADQLHLQRLKRRKLAVKDALKKVEEGLVPDIIA